jgi:hypothetical protein
MTDVTCRLCCHHDCGQPAELYIVDGPAPDQYTEACPIHIMALLSDTTISVYPICIRRRATPA